MDTIIIAEVTTLRQFLSAVSFKSNGDAYERDYGHFLSDSFPNCERLWRIFVVPLTCRMEGYPALISHSIGFRPSVSPDLEDISILHYSMFINLVYAHLHWAAKTQSSLEDIYVHLGSACDLAELTLVKWHLVLLRCRGEESCLLRRLTREEFLEYTGKWYDGKYTALYENYSAKGKPLPIFLPPRVDILTEYLGANSQERRNYSRCSQSIREFRNVIVHDAKVARIVDAEGRMVVPRPRVIHKYRTWRQVAQVVGNAEVIRADFTEAYHQAREDISVLETALNSLWGKMIGDFEEEFYSKERATLGEMYNMKFSSDAPQAVQGTPAVRSINTNITQSGYTGGSVDFPVLDDDSGSAYYPKGQ